MYSVRTNKDNDFKQWYWKLIERKKNELFYKNISSSDGIVEIKWSNDGEYLLYYRNLYVKKSGIKSHLSENAGSEIYALHIKTRKTKKLSKDWGYYKYIGTRYSDNEEKILFERHYELKDKDKIYGFSKYEIIETDYEGKDYKVIYNKEYIYNLGKYFDLSPDGRYYPIVFKSEYQEKPKKYQDIKIKWSTMGLLDLKTGQYDLHIDILDPSRIKWLDNENLIIGNKYSAVRYDKEKGVKDILPQHLSYQKRELMYFAQNLILYNIKTKEIIRIWT